MRLRVSLARRYAAPSSQGRVCAEIGSVISEQQRLSLRTVGSCAGMMMMMMVLGILHGRKVPLSTLMRVVFAIGQGETLLSAHFATAGQWCDTDPIPVGRLDAQEVSFILHLLNHPQHTHFPAAEPSTTSSTTIQPKINKQTLAALTS